MQMESDGEVVPDTCRNVAYDEGPVKEGGNWVGSGSNSEYHDIEIPLHNRYLPVSKCPVAATPLEEDEI